MSNSQNRYWIERGWLRRRPPPPPNPPRRRRAPPSSRAAAHHGLRAPAGLLDGPLDGAATLVWLATSFSLPGAGERFERLLERYRSQLAAAFGAGAILDPAAVVALLGGDERVAAAFETEGDSIDLEKVLLYLLDTTTETP